MKVIETNNITKRYGRITAVDSVSLSVNQGEIYGFLGLNGAGKTTTIRMLLGMVQPSRGSACILGQSIGPRSVNLWSSVGYLVEMPYAYPELTVLENLEVFQRLRNVPWKAISDIVDRLQLQAYAHRKAGTLSLGNAQRLGLAKALMHRPQVLILDEPANGLDPAGIVEIRQLLRELTRDHGTTILMSSHILGEVARLADRIGIIHQGRLLSEISATELEVNRQRYLRVGTHNDAKAALQLQRVGFAVQQSDGYLELWDSRAIQKPDEVAIALVQADLAPTTLFVEQENLESYFLRLVGTTN